MILGIVASDGRVMEPFWFQTGFRLRAQDYLKVLKTVVMPWVRADFAEQRVIWQQCSAPAHKAKIVQQYCADKTVSGFNAFWPALMWPPHLPNLNPLDYSIWWEVKRVACVAPHSLVDALKALVTSVWNALDADYVRATCARFRPLIDLMIARDGGYVETK